MYVYIYMYIYIYSLSSLSSLVYHCNTRNTRNQNRLRG